MTLRSMSLLANPSYCVGTVVRKLSFDFVIPVTSLPVISTRATWPESTHATNSLKLTLVSLRWNLAEKFQTSTAMASRTIQKTALFTAEFNGASRPALGGVHVILEGGAPHVEPGR